MCPLGSVDELPQARITCYCSTFQRRTLFLVCLSHIEGRHDALLLNLNDTRFPAKKTGCRDLDLMWKWTLSTIESKCRIDTITPPHTHTHTHFKNTSEDTASLALACSSTSRHLSCQHEDEQATCEEVNLTASDVSEILYWFPWEVRLLVEEKLDWA